MGCPIGVCQKACISIARTCGQRVLKSPGKYLRQFPPVPRYGRRLGYRLSTENPVPQSATAMPFCALMSDSNISYLSKARRGEIHHPNKTYQPEPTRTHVEIPSLKNCTQPVQRLQCLDRRIHPSQPTSVPLPSGDHLDGRRIASKLPRCNHLDQFLEDVLNMGIPDEDTYRTFRVCEKIKCLTI